MADSNFLRVEISADTKDLQKAIALSTVDLKKFGNQAKNAFAGVKPGANEAAFALQNVGRVAQDVPFGFIGIQNNLNPLLESFQRVKAVTGSTGSALKAMAGSLVGAGGLGLALSVVSSAILLYQNGMMGMGRKTKEATDKTKELGEAIKGTSEIQQQAGASIEAEVSKVRTLAAAVLDLSNSTQVRKRGLEELRKTNKTYFGELKFEADSLATLTTKVDEYTRALLNQAITKGYSDEIGRQNTELFKQRNILVGLRDKFLQSSKAQEELNAPAKRNKSGYIIIPKNIKDIREQAAALDENREAFAKQKQAVFQLEDGVMSLDRAYRASIVTELEMKSITGGLTTADQAATEAIKQRIAALKELIEAGIDVTKNTLELRNLDIKLTLHEATSRGMTQQEARALLKLKYPEFDGQGITLTKPVVLTVPFVVRRVVVPESDSGGGDPLVQGQQRMIDNIVNSANKARTALISALDKIKTPLETLSDSINSTLKNTFTGLGEALGEAFTMKNPASGFLNVIAQALQDLGKALIAYAVASKAAQAALQSFNPFLAAAVGIAAIAAGAVLKQKINNPIKLAQGGVTTGPTFAMIGESGREAVIPLNRMGDMMGSGNTQVEFVRSQISGGDIFQLWKIHNARNNRLY